MTKPIVFHENAAFAANKEKWQVYKDFYEGDHEVMIQPKYLTYHELELFPQGASLRRIRAERTTYTNDLEMVISRYVALVYRDDPDFSEVEDLFGEAGLKDVDGKGTTFADFIQDELLVHYFRDGRPMVLVDSFPVQALSAGEEQERGIRPFLELLEALSVPDYEVETQDPARIGKFNFVRVEYDYIPPRSSPEEAPETIRASKVYRHAPGGYTITKYHRKDDKKDNGTPSSKPQWEQQGEPKQVTGIPEIPIAWMPKATSWIKDLISPIKGFFNQESALDNQLGFQAHQRIFTIGEATPEEIVAASEYTMPNFPEGTTIHTIAPSDPVALDRRCKDLQAKIVRLAFNRLRTVPADSGEAEAADTLREANKDFVQLVRSTIQQLEDFINEIVRLYALFKKKPDFKGRAKLNKDVTEEDIAEQREILAIFLSRWERKSRTMMKELDKKYARKMNLPNMEKIERELDQDDPEPQTDPGLGRNAVLDRFASRVNENDNAQAATAQNRPADQGNGRAD